MILCLTEEQLTGFAFVEFEEMAQAEEAIKEMHGVELFGGKIRLGTLMVHGCFSAHRPASILLGPSIPV